MSGFIRRSSATVSARARGGVRSRFQGPGAMETYFLEAGRCAWVIAAASAGRDGRSDVRPISRVTSAADPVGDGFQQPRHSGIETRRQLGINRWRCDRQLAIVPDVFASSVPSCLASHDRSAPDRYWRRPAKTRNALSAETRPLSQTWRDPPASRRSRPDDRIVIAILTAPGSQRLGSTRIGVAGRGRSTC